MKKFLRNGLIKGKKNEDIEKISLNYTHGYGYLLSYDYVNEETGYSKWVKEPEMYINYIVDNNGYNGPYIYNNFFNIIKYGIIFMLVFPIILFIFCILIKLKQKYIQKN